jgi:hypothetical protein
VHAWLPAEDLVQNRIFADLQKSATQHTANPAKIYRQRFLLSLSLKAVLNFAAARRARAARHNSTTAMQQQSS